MVKLLRKDRIKFLIILCFASVSSSLLLMGKIDANVDLISTLTSSNYICLILNNIYIYYIYTRAKKIKSIHDKIIVRIGQDSFFNCYVINFILDILVYFLLVMLPIYMRVGINFSYINIFIVYFVLNFTNFIIQEVVSMLIFLLPRGNKYIVIPIFMNFGFHYFLIPYIVGILFGM